MTDYTPVEITLHRLPILLMTGASVSTLFEYAFRQSVLPQIIRTFCVFSIGVWGIFSSFVLFVPTPFPGFKHNPAWDRHDENNVHFLEASFGFLLTMNSGFLLTSMVVMKRINKYGRRCTATKSSIKCNYELLGFSDTKE